MSEDHTSNSPWEDDYLQRSKEAELLKSFLLRRVEERSSLGRSRSFVLNIDAQWGTGKTFFLERFGQQLKQEGYIVAHVNAWEDDYADDPLIPVLASIESAVEPFLGKSKEAADTLKAIRNNGVEIAVSLTRNFLVTLARKHVGDAVDEISDLLANAPSETIKDSVGESASEAIKELGDKASRAILDRYLKDKDASASFKSKLASLTKQLGKKNTKHRQMFVLVDELDRCRPTYAIQLLERVKHLFDTNGIIFVIATDTSQLRHSIQAVYGAGFDSAKYLQRFFDRQYRFRNVSLSSFVKQLRLTQIPLTNVSVPPIRAKTLEDQFDQFAVGTINGFDLGPRESQKALELFSDFVTTWKHSSKVEAMYLLPLICAKLKFSIDLYELNITSAHSQIFKKHLDWTLVDDFDRSRQRRSHTAYSFFSALHDCRKLNLPEIPTALSSNSSFASEWARERFIEEFNLNHQGRHKANQFIASCLCEYVPGIESVEHLATPEVGSST